MFSGNTRRFTSHAFALWAACSLGPPARAGESLPRICATHLAEMAGGARPRAAPEEPIDVTRIDVVRRKPPEAPTDAEEFRVRETYLLRGHVDLAFQLLFDKGAAEGGIRAPTKPNGDADVPEFLRTGQRDLYRWDSRTRRAAIYVKPLPKTKHGESPLLDQVPHESAAYADRFAVATVIHEYTHHVWGRDLASRVVEWKKSKSSADRDLATRLEAARDQQWFLGSEELFCDLAAVLYAGDGAAVSKLLKASYGKEAVARDFTKDHPLDKAVAAEHDRLAPVRSWIGKHLLKSGLSDAEVLRRVHKVLLAHAADVMRSQTARFYARTQARAQNEEIVELLRVEFSDLAGI